MALNKPNKQVIKLIDILYSSDVCSLLRISQKTLQRWEKKGLPYTRSEHTNMKMYVESEVSAWLLGNNK